MKTLTKIYACIAAAASLFAAALCAGCTTENSLLIELHTWGNTSGVPNNVIAISFDDRDVNVKISAATGVFWDKNSGSYVNEIERAAVDFEISWYYGGAEEFTQDFVRIMLLKSDLAVGCAVIKIEPTKSWYSAAVCEKILYTQPVPIQQAESEIEQIVLENQ